MKPLPLLLALLCNSASLHAAPADYEIRDGNQLLAAVNLTIRVLEAGSDAKASPNEEFMIAKLSGYLQGIREMHEAMAGFGHRAFDIPQNVSQRQILYIVQKYLKTYPERLHESALHCINRALIETFPSAEMKPKPSKP